VETRVVVNVVLPTITPSTFPLSPHPSPSVAISLFFRPLFPRGYALGQPRVQCATVGTKFSKDSHHNNPWWWRRSEKTSLQLSPSLQRRSNIQTSRFQLYKLFHRILTNIPCIHIRNQINECRIKIMVFWDVTPCTFALRYKTARRRILEEPQVSYILLLLFSI
jgi:hypothetical protein